MIYTFEVKSLWEGQRRRYGDSFYEYQVTSSLPEDTVKKFCMNVLRKSYERKDMPSPFSGELEEFTKLGGSTDDNGVLTNVYIYKVRELFTD